VDDSKPKGYFLPADAKLNDIGTYVPMSQVQDILCKLPCKHLLIMLDCCYAGAFKWQEVKRGIRAEKPVVLSYRKYKQYVSNKAMQVIASTASDQQASDFNGRNNESPNSPFADWLADALDNKKGADFISPGQETGDGIITTTELGMYLRDHLSNDKQIPAIWPIGDNTKGEFIFFNPALQQQKIILLDKDIPNPFKGLFSYSAHDKDVFFGRQWVLDGWKDGETAHDGLRKIVQDNSIVLVTGRSGIGKSSLVKAGILSAVDVARIREIKPGNEPNNPDNQKILDELADNKQTQFYLLVDQYEGLVTLCDDEAERKRFEERLNTIARLHKVIITLRSDFEVQFTESPVIGKNATYKRFEVPAFSRDDINDIVIGPANLMALEYRGIPISTKEDQAIADDRFINRIIDDAFRYPYSLPLLSLALSKLYDDREPDQMDNVDYLIEGKYKGVASVIEEVVEAEFEKYADSTAEIANADQQQEQTNGATLQAPLAASQLLFMQLIFRMMSFEGSEVTRRKVYTCRKDKNGVVHNELEFDNPATTATVKRIKESLVNARLLRVDEDGEGEYVEPSHEALLRSWPRLNKILFEKDDRQSTYQEKILLLDQLSKQVQNYLDAKPGERQGLLWVKDYRLQQVLQYKRAELGLNSMEEEFIERSRKAKRRQKNFWIGFRIAVLAIAVGIIGYYIYSSNKLNDQLAQSFWDRGLNAGEQNELTKGLLYTTEALNRVADNNLRAEMLMSANDKIPSIVLQNIITTTGYIDGLDVSRDGKKILVLSDSALQLYDAATGTIRASSKNLKVDEALFSNDGATIFARSAKTVSVLDDALQVKASFSEKENITAIDVDSAGKLVLTGTEDGVASIWKYDGDRAATLLDTFTCNYIPATIKISPDGRYLFTTNFLENSDSNKCDLWDVRQRSSLYANPNGISVYALNDQLTKVFISDWNTGVTETYEVGRGTAVWDTKHYLGDNYFITSTTFTDDSTLVLSDNNGVAYWNFNDASRQSSYAPVSKSDIYDIRYSKAANYFLISDNEGKTALCDSELQYTGELMSVQRVYPAVSDDGKIIMMADSQHIYTYRYVPVQQHFFGNTTLRKIILSTDNRYAATLDSTNSLALWDVAADTLLYHPYKSLMLDSFRIANAVVDKYFLDHSGTSTNEIDLSDYLMLRSTVYEMWANYGSILFHPNGTIVIPFEYGIDSAIVCNVYSNVETTIPFETGANANSPISPDGKEIIFTSADGFVHLLSVPMQQNGVKWKEEVLGELGSNNKQCYFLGSTQQVVCLKNDNSVYIINLLDKTKKMLVSNANSGDISITMGRNGSWGIISNGDVNLCVFRAVENGKHFKYERITGSYKGSKTGRFLYTVVPREENYVDGIKVIDVANGTSFFKKPSFRINDSADIQVNEDKQLMLVPTSERYAVVLQLPALKQVGYRLMFDKNDDTYSSRISLSNNGKYILHYSNGAWRVFDYMANRTLTSMHFPSEENPTIGFFSSDDKMIYLATDADYSIWMK